MNNDVMIIQFASGHRFKTVEITSDIVTFFNGSWEYKCKGKWVKNMPAEFIVIGATKKGAEVIDFTQKAHCIVKDEATKDVVYEKHSRFLPGCKQPGVRLQPSDISKGKKYRRNESRNQLSEREIFEIEFGKGCGSFRQCILLINRFAERESCDPETYRQASESMQKLLASAIETAAVIFPCSVLHYLEPNDNDNWNDGTLYGIPFANTIKPEERLFTLCKRTDEGRCIALFDLILEKNGMWTTPSFVGLNSVEYPQVALKNFDAAMKWLMTFACINLDKRQLKIFSQDDPLIERHNPQAQATCTALVKYTPKTA